jgi:hypothetical protein
MKKLALTLMILVLSLPLWTASAQNSITVTVTESQLNSALRVQNPTRTTVNNVVVDVQEGQVVISATFTPRRGSTSYAVAATFVPKLVNSGTRTRLEWDVTSFTVNGQAGSSQYTAWRNNLSSALRAAGDTAVGRTFNVQNVVVSGNAISITGTRP